jgi:[ribosomal protein S5]-alanine N-acetyltransferase
MSLDQAFDVLEDDDRCRLQTARYTLTPLRADDVGAVLAHFSDERVTEFLDIRPLSGRSDAYEVIGWAEHLRACGSGVRWGIRDAAGGFVGTCGFHMISYLRGRRAEVGYDLSPAVWGRGASDEVLAAALGFGFGALGLHRIEALVTPQNRWSSAVLERQGFQREGRLRDYAFWKDRFWDQLLYARLATDPPA